MKLFRLVPVLFVLVLVACSEDDGLLRQIPQDGVILSFGDSLTAGTGAGDGQDYPSQLAALSGMQVVNAGVPGETSGEGLVRLPAILEQYRPSLVILCHGGNDILRNMNRAQTAANITDMIGLSQTGGAKVLLVGVPRKGLFLSTADFYSGIADKTGTLLEDSVISEVLRDRDLKSDSVHPNAAGYRIVAERIFKMLR